MCSSDVEQDISLMYFFFLHLFNRALSTAFQLRSLAFSLFYFYFYCLLLPGYKKVVRVTSFIAEKHL